MGAKLILVMILKLREATHTYFYGNLTLKINIDIYSSVIIATRKKLRHRSWFPRAGFLLCRLHTGSGVDYLVSELYGEPYTQGKVAGA